jgi:hypothetical protein
LVEGDQSCIAVEAGGEVLEIIYQTSPLSRVPLIRTLDMSSDHQADCGNSQQGLGNAPESVTRPPKSVTTGSDSMSTTVDSNVQERHFVSNCGQHFAGSTICRQLWRTNEKTIVDNCGQP